MSIILNDNLNIRANKPIDDRYLNISIPWTSVGEVNSNIHSSYRYTGLTVNINKSEYWYENGIGDGDLIPKILYGGAFNAVNGITLSTNSGNTFSLGGTLTGNTVFDGGYTLQYGGDYSSSYTNRSLVDKEYVDLVSAGLKPLAAVDVATTTSITLSGLTIVDGIQLVHGDRILVKNQINAVDNGIYSASTGVWGRTSDFNGIPESESYTGSYAFVLTGNTNYNTAWVLITENPIIGVTELNFVLFTKIQAILAGVGIIVSATTNGYQISFDGANVAGTMLNWNGTQLSVNSNTQGIINNSITGATNGLTKYGNHNVGLGGNLTGDTMITLPFASITSFIAGEGDNTNWSGGRIGIYRNNITASNNYALLGARIDSSNVSKINANATTGITINTTISAVYHGLKLNNNALVYDNNYHSDYVNRTLVDKEYVDLANNNNLKTASNGLTAVGSDVRLGGVLTGDTVLSGAYNLSLSSGAFSVGDDYRINDITILKTTANNSSVFLGKGAGYSTNYKNNELHITNNTGSTLIYGDFTGNTVTIPTIKISTTPNNNTVDDVMIWNPVNKTIEKTSRTQLLSPTITGATNGLTKVNNNVELGGDLNGNTTINLLNNNLNIVSDNISVCGLAKFGLDTTYANSEIVFCSHDATNTAKWAFTGNSASISAHHYLNSSNGSEFAIGNTSISMSTKISNVDRGIVLGSNALSYNACYHSDYVNRTLVDKEYVDLKVSGASNITNVTNVGNVYTTLSTDEFVGVSGTSCIYLYDSPVKGQTVIVADICGNAQAAVVTIDGNGKNINGSACATINTDYGAISFVYNNYFWSAVGFVN